MTAFTKDEERLLKKKRKQRTSHWTPERRKEQSERMKTLQERVAMCMVVEPRDEEYMRRVRQETES
jgi:hypothetical protein